MRSILNSTIRPLKSSFTRLMSCRITPIISKMAPTRTKLYKPILVGSGLLVGGTGYYLATHQYKAATIAFTHNKSNYSLNNETLQKIKFSKDGYGDLPKIIQKSIGQIDFNIAEFFDVLAIKLNIDSFKLVEKYFKDDLKKYFDENSLKCIEHLTQTGNPEVCTHILENYGQNVNAIEIVKILTKRQNVISDIVHKAHEAMGGGHNYLDEHTNYLSREVPIYGDIIRKLTLASSELDQKDIRKIFAGDEQYLDYLLSDKYLSDRKMLEFD